MNNKRFSFARNATKVPLALGLLAVMLFAAVSPAYAAYVQIQSVSVGGPSGTVTYGTPGSVSYTVTVVCTGKGTGTNFPLSISSTLPTGVSWSFFPSTLYFDNGCGNSPFTQTSTLTLTTTASAPGGVFSFSAAAGGQTGAGSLTINGIALTVVGAQFNNKVYNGDTGDTILTPGTLSAGVIDPPDTVVLDYSAAGGTFTTKQVGNDKPITGYGFTLTGSKASNYSLVQPTGYANITPRPLQIHIGTVASKDYDGSDAAAVTLTMANKVSGDDVSASGTGTFADRHAGLNKNVSVSSVTLSGFDASNYYVDTSEATAQANIYQRALTITAAVDNKPYDGTNSSGVKPTITSGALQGSDTAGFSQTFDDKNVGSGKTLTPSGVVNDGNAGADYTYSFATNTNGVITPASLTVSATGVNKTYDGTTDATVALSDNRAFGDFITASYTAAAFADENVGTSKAVSVSGISISGTDAGNYTLSSTSASTSANIVARAITVAPLPNTKVYDGNVSASAVPTISAGSLAVGDTANFTEAYSDKNAGSGKTLVTAGSVSDGNSGNNYNVTFASDITGVIQPRPITSVTAHNQAISDKEPLPAFTFQYGAGDLVSGDTLASAPTCSATVPNPLVAGSYPIKCSGGSDPNYDFSATNYVDATLTVSASGVPHVAASPNPLNFGYQLVGTSSLAKTITITNNASGPVSLDISSISISGAPFSLITAGSTCFNGSDWSGSLAQAASCTVNVKFAPAVAGTPSGSLTIVSNDVANPSYAVTLVGTGSAGVQILANRSFELDRNGDRVPDRWQKGGTWSLADGEDCSVRYNGKCSLKFVANRKLNTAQLSLLKSGPAGTGFTFALYSKALNVPAASQYNVRILLYNGTTLVGTSDIVNFTKGSHKFKVAQGTFTAPADFTKIVFKITFKANSGSVWFDLGSLKW